MAAIECYNTKGGKTTISKVSGYRLRHLEELGFDVVNGTRINILLYVCVCVCVFYVSHAVTMSEYMSGQQDLAASGFLAVNLMMVLQTLLFSTAIQFIQHLSNILGDFVQYRGLCQCTFTRQSPGACEGL